MNLIRYNPNRWFDFPFDRFFDDSAPMGAAASTAAAAPVFSPRVDIREEAEAVVLSTELPGVDKHGIKVELENGVLTLSGEKRSERSEQENGFYRSERVYGQFKRAFQVFDSVEVDRIAAEYTNGVLTVRLPKKPEAAPRSIEIAAGKEAITQIATQ